MLDHILCSNICIYTNHIVFAVMVSSNSAQHILYILLISSKPLLILTKQIIKHINTDNKHINRDNCFQHMFRQNQRALDIDYVV